MDPTIVQQSLVLTSDQMSMLIMGIGPIFIYLLFMCFMSTKPAKYVWLAFIPAVLSAIGLFFMLPLFIK